MGPPTLGANPATQARVGPRIVGYRLAGKRHLDYMARPTLAGWIHEIIWNLEPFLLGGFVGPKWPFSEH